MKPAPHTLPIEADFLDPRSQDPDERYALRMFLGKTAEQAEAMFRRDFLGCQEDLTHMGAVAFRFYLRPAIAYLLSGDASGDADAASSFCGLLKLRLAHDPESLLPVAPIVLDAIDKILDRFDRFECTPDIYGDVPARYRAVARRLAEGRGD